MEGVSVVVVLLFILGVVLTLLHVMVRKSRAGVLFDKLPGPKPLPWIGNAFQMSLDRAEEFLLIRRNISLYKDLHRFWILHKRILNVYNPEDMETITSSSSLIEKGEFYAFLHPWLNEGLLVSTGNKWHHRRKILTTSFHFNILKHFCKVLEENSQRTAAELQELEDKDQVDVTYHMKKCALYAICETSMGTKLSEDKSSDVARYKYAIEEVGKLVFSRFIKVWLHPDFLFKISSMGKFQIKMLNILHNFTDKVIRERRAYREANGENALPEDLVSDEAGAYGGKKRYAMLDTLLKAEKRGMIDQAGIREEVDTFMFEGHDTLTTGLTFCLFTLANNRTEQDKAYEEIVSILGKDKKEADLNDYGEMKYLECCLKEALRLYPPVPFFARRLRSEVQLRDYLIPADTECFLHVFDLHRRADLWPEPLEFRPERFLPDAPPRHPYAYLPFSAGPRNCIGQRYAMVTLKSVVASILHQFILEPVTRTEELVFVVDLVLRTENPVYIKLTPRIKAA